MSLTLLPADELHQLKAELAEAGYHEAGLTRAVQSCAPPGRAELPRFLHLTSDSSALSLLARAFLAGMPVPSPLAARAWPERLLALCRSAGLLEPEQGALKPRVTLVPRGELLFAADAAGMLASPGAGGFVLPAHTHAAGYLLDVTVRRQVSRTLDLGTGCGVQALVAAAHSGQVFATDVNPRAVQYAAFNARLNGLAHVECLQGDLFAPVAGRHFDLIICNPPFVPGPGQGYAWRDAGVELDGLCQRIVREAPGFLAEGGILQMLCEWVELENEPWRERLERWLDGLGCDAWVLQSAAQAPAHYAAIRLNELPAAPGQAGDSYAEWVEYFSAHRVRAIHPGVIVLRRRAGHNWLHVQPLGRSVTGPAGEAILENIAACDFLAQGGTDVAALLDAVLRPVSGLQLDLRHRRSEQGWEVEAIRACRTDALPLDAEIDAASAALLREFDGVATTRECLQRFGRQVSDDPAQLQRRCLPAVKFFIERGFLLPPA